MMISFNVQNGPLSTRKPLIGIFCEFSGRVRDSFIDDGYNAISFDLLLSESPKGPHIQGDVIDFLNLPFDLVIAFPPCRYLCGAGNRHRKKWLEEGKVQPAIDFFLAIANMNCPQICIENPVGIMSKVWRPPDQYIQPYWFGDSVQKKTGLWLKNLPPLTPTNIVDRGQIYVDPRGIKHGGAHTMLAKKGYLPLMLLQPEAKYNPGGEERWKIRSRTFRGIAEAMAKQWGPLLTKEEK